MPFLEQAINSLAVSRAAVSRRSGLFVWLVVCLALAGCAGGRFATDADIKAATVGKNLIVLQSDGSPAFAGVTQAITERWKGGIVVLNLNGKSDADAELARKLKEQRGGVVVAVGLRAALAARKLQGTRAIFCQVFNYEDFDLLSPGMKGVSAMPPIGQQFQVWKKLDPKLAHVGVITGPRLQHLVAEARQAAAASGIEIHYAQVNSDIEALYAYKQLSPKIQGLWLLPDNRILSRNAIRDLLSHSRKQGKQVAVFSEQLLSLGGMMNFDSVYGDIADQVIVRSLQALETDGPEVPGPSMLPLTRLDIKINPDAVKQLGLKIPAELKAMVYVP